MADAVAGPAATPAAAPTTVAEAVQLTTAVLGAAGIPRARFEARLLVAHSLGIEAAAVFARPERRLDAASGARLAGLVRRRADREPMAYLTGVREFWSLAFAVSPATLIPRPESETVIEAALARLPPEPAPGLRVLDLGTGSGCLLLALLAERAEAWGVGVDRSAAAVAVARANAEALGLAGRAAFLCGDWATAIDGRFDLVVSNPPYIADADLAGLAPEVGRYEPRLALAGGADGLDACRRILAGLARLIAPGGAAVVETGAGQAPAVAAIAAGQGLQISEIREDLAGHGRCVVMAAAVPARR